MLLNCPNNRYVNDEKICQAVVAMWARIGIKAPLMAENMATYAQKFQNFDTSLYLLGWGVATYDAQFALTEVKQGLLPAVISPYLLAAIGERYCRRYMLSAERFSAAEAYRIGLLHEIVPGEEQLDDAIGEIIENLLKGGPHAQAECKTLIRGIGGQPIDESTIEESLQRVTRVRSSPEGLEGLSALLEKRKPNWAE